MRIMLFYDGSYFRRGQTYFRYKEERGLFSLYNLHLTIEKYIANLTKSPVETTKVVGAHFYDGRATSRVSTDDQLRKERAFEMALIEAGIVPHFMPLTEKPRYNSEQETNNNNHDDQPPRFTLAQKGVDVQLALDVLDYAHIDRFDVVVLITGDADFVPLVKKVTSLGRQVVIAYFEFESWLDRYNKPHRACYSARALSDAATWSLNFNTFVRDRNWSDEVRSLFFMPREV